jgi:hypothetical protein
LLRDWAAPGVIPFEGTAGTISTTLGSTFERTAGAISYNINGRDNPPSDDTPIIIDAKELDIPYDMIIGRDSIIQHSLLMYDPDFNTFGMRKRQRDD